MSCIRFRSFFAAARFVFSARFSARLRVWCVRTRVDPSLLRGHSFPTSSSSSSFASSISLSRRYRRRCVRGSCVDSRHSLAMRARPREFTVSAIFRSVFRNVPLANAPARARWIAKAPRRREGGDEGERRRDKEGRETGRKSGRHGASPWINRTISTEIGKEERKLEGPAAGDVRRRERQNACVCACGRTCVRACVGMRRLSVSLFRGRAHCGFQIGMQIAST